MSPTWTSETYWNQSGIVAMLNEPKQGAGNTLSALTKPAFEEQVMADIQPTHAHSAPQVTKPSGSRHAHGMTHTPTWHSWQGMKSRCYNQNFPEYKNYGARGITVCKRWLESFEDFLADMGQAPEGMSLDRHPDKNGNYEPGNCRWATPKQQSRNTRRNHPITAFGETKIVIEWAEDPRCAVGINTLRSRIRRGIAAEAAITTPPRPFTECGRLGGRKGRGVPKSAEHVARVAASLRRTKSKGGAK